jgi:hypothetical protein
MRNLNKNNRMKLYLHFIRIVFVCFLFISIADAQQLPGQISSIEEKVFTDRTEALIKGYFDNLTTISKLDEEKDIFIGEFINSSFDNNKVRVYNDIDLTGGTQIDFDIPTYLDNISLFFSSSDVDFEIQRMKLSKIFYSSDFFFVKAEVVRKMTIRLNQQSKIDSALIDIYVKFIPYKSNPRIYSIKKHENNLSQFKLVAVTAADKNESLNNDVVMFENSSPLPDIKPGEFYLNTAPEGATIEFIDYPDFGKKNTPVTLKYPATKYAIRITKSEYETLETTINIGVDKSKSFSLVPTFAYLNFDITPDNADVLVNGEKVLFVNDNKYDTKVPKGKTVVEISAEHYYPKSIELNTEAGKIHNVEEMLKPRTGTLTLIADNNDANGATITIDNIKVGTIPLSKYVILEGKHAVKIEKAKLSTVVKIVEIKENSESKINIGMYATIKTAITTDPSGATIFIDGKRIGTSNLTTKLPVGSYSIRMEKDYFETKTENIVIHEIDQSGKFSYTLIPLKYSIHLNSKPVGAEIYFEGNSKGTTPLTIQTTKGLHSFKIYKEHYFPRSFISNVSSSGTSSVRKVLYPKRMLNLNLIYGLNSWGFELGGTVGYFSLAVGLSFPKYDLYKDEVSPLHKNENFSFDSKYMVETNQKISIKEDETDTTVSSPACWTLKGGFVLLKPFMMRIHGGYGWRYNFYYYKIYKATSNFTYSGNNGNGTVMKDELLIGSEIKQDKFNSFLIGIEIPIRKLNLGSDYWFDSEKGPGIVFILGLNLF